MKLKKNYEGKNLNNKTKFSKKNSSNSQKIYKLLIILFLSLLFKVNFNIVYKKKAKDNNFLKINKEKYNSTIFYEIKNNSNQNFSNNNFILNNSQNISSNLSSYSSSNVTINVESIIYMAIKYYNKSEYYKSSKECEKLIGISDIDNNNKMEIYQLQAFNYIKMFDLEKAKEYLKLSENIDINNLKNKEINALIQEEENKNNENLKKYKKYPAYLNFMKNLYKMGVFVNKLEINFVTENFRFCRATGNIKRKELLLRIPLEAIITNDVAKGCPMAVYFTNNLINQLNSPKQMLLTTFLLNEIDKGNQSKWKFYLDFLPSNYSNFPSFYGKKEYEILNGTQFLESLEKKKRSIKKDYDLLAKYIPGFSKYDFNFFKKWREVVGSRVFGVIINGKRNTIIVPFADLLNHKRPQETYWNYDNKASSFFIEGTANIKEGHEVFDSYGQKTNSVFLLNYGFTDKNNKYIKFRIDLELNKTYPFLDEKMIFLKWKSLNKSFEIELQFPNDNSKAFFSFLRLMLYNQTNFRSINNTKPISIENEIDLFNKIKEIMSNYLSRYSTNFDDDINYLEKNKDNIDFNSYNCYIIRIDEKKILNYYLNMANNILQLINSDKHDINSIYNYLFSSFRNRTIVKDKVFADKLLEYKQYLYHLFPLLLNK